jgi:hypothetical protein
MAVSRKCSTAGGQSAPPILPGRNSPQVASRRIRPTVGPHGLPRTFYRRALGHAEPQSALFGPHNLNSGLINSILCWKGSTLEG